VVTAIGLKWAGTVPEQAQGAILEALERFPTNAVETYWTHRRSTVGRVSIDGRSFLIKRYNAAKPSARLRRLLGVNPARRAWKSATVMGQLGIATPAVLGIVTAGRRGRLRPGTYLVTEYLPAQTSDVFLGAGLIPRERKRAVADRILQAVQRLHRHGYVHGDLKGKNILVSDDVPYFIDLDTLGRPRWGFSRRRGQKNDCARLFRTNPLLLQYADSVPDWVM